MPCKLVFSDRVLSDMLGQKEFDSIDELRTAFQQLLDKHPVIPVVIRANGTTFNKYAKASTTSDGTIRIEIPIPGQENFDDFKFVTKVTENLEPSTFGKIRDRRVLELEDIDSFMAFYLANYIHLGDDNSPASMHDRLEEFAYALAGLGFRIDNGKYSFAVADLRFAKNLGEYFNLLKEFVPDFPDNKTIKVGGVEYTANIPEVIEKVFKLAEEFDKSRNNQRQRANKDEWVAPKKDPVPEHEIPSGIFFDAFDTENGKLSDNPVALGRRILLRSMQNPDDFRVRLALGELSHAQSAPLTTAQVTQGVVGILEKWEGGEWKPVFVHKDTKLQGDSIAVLTTDPASAYLFSYRVDDKELTSPQLTLMLKHGKQQGRVKNIKDEFKVNPGEVFYKVQEVRSRERGAEKPLSEIGVSLDKFGVENVADQPTSGRIYMRGKEKVEYNITRGRLTPEEVDDVMQLLSFVGSKEEADKIAEYLNNYIGLGQDIANLFDDPKSQWHYSKLNSSRVVTFRAAPVGKGEGFVVEVYGERKKVGDKFVVEAEQKWQQVSKKNKSLIQSYVEAASIYIVKGEESNISLAWTNLKVVESNGVKSLKEENWSGAKREKFYKDHITSAYGLEAEPSTVLVAYPNPEGLQRQDRQAKKLTIGDFSYTENNAVTEGTIRQMLNTLLKKFPQWESHQLDLLSALFDNVEPTTFKWVSAETITKELGRNSPAIYQTDTKEIWLNMDFFTPEKWVWLMPVILEEKIHHATTDNLSSPEWRDSQEVRNLMALRQRMLEEWNKPGVKERFNSEEQRRIEYRLEPESAADSREALLEFVGGIAASKAFSDFADSIQVEEKSLLQKAIDTVKKLFAKMLAKLTGVKKEIVTEILNVSFGKPTIIENKAKKKLPIIGKKENAYTKKNLSAGPEEYVDYALIKGMDGEASRILFEYGLFTDFVAGLLDKDRFLDTVRNDLIDQTAEDNSPEREDFLLTILQSEEAFKNVIDEWMSRSLLFKLSEGKFLVEREDEKADDADEDAQSEEASNEGEFNNWGRTEQTKSSIEEADRIARTIIKLTPKVENGQYVYNNGYLQLVDYTSFWNKVQSLVKDSYDYNTMLDKLGKVRDAIPEVGVLIDRLNLLGISLQAQIVRSAIQRSFARAHVPTYVVEFREGKGYLKEQSGIDRQKIEELFNYNFVDFLDNNKLTKSVTATRETKEGTELVTYQSYKVKELRNLLLKVQANFPQLAALWQEMGLDIPAELLGDNDDAIRFRAALTSFTKAATNKLTQLANANYNPETDFLSLLKYTQVLGDMQVSGYNAMWSTVVDIISKYSDITVSNMTHNAAGDNQSNLHTYSSQTVLYNIINEEFSKGVSTEEAIEKCVARGVTRLNNPIFKYSLTAQNLSAQNPLVPINVSGSRVFDGEQYAGVNTIDLDLISYLRQEFFTLLFHGVKENLRAETANTSLGLKFKYYSFGKSRDIPIPVAKFGNNNWQDNTLQIFSGYLKGEVERIKKEFNSNFVYYDGYEQVKTKFGLLSFLPEEWVNHIKESTLSPEELAEVFYSEHKKEFRKILLAQIEQGKKDFVNWVEKETGLKFDEANPILDSQVANFLGDLNMDQLANAFFVNSLILNIEHVILSHGEIGQFADKFYKRSKSNISVGTPASFSSLYDTLGVLSKDTYTFRLYGQVPDYYKKSGTPRARSFIMKDDILVPTEEWLDELQEGVKQSLLLSDKAFGIKRDEQEVEDEARGKVRGSKKYNKTNVSDGAAYVHPDFGRALLLAVGSWTQEMEEGYKYLLFKSLESVAPEEQHHIDYVDNKIERNNGKIYWVFPTIKAQYRGNSIPLKGKPVSAIEQLDKFALTWLFPTNDKEATLLNAMTKGHYAYTKFESGSKVGTYNADDVLLSIEQGTDIQINSGHFVFLDFMKEQVKTPDEAKSKTIFPTQQRKLLVSNLKYQAKFIENMQDPVLQWKKSQHQIAEKERIGLLKQLGATDMNNPEIDLRVFADLVKKELSRREMPESITSIFDRFETDYYRQFESAISPQMVETMLFSLLKNRIVRTKFDGSQLIQKPSSLHDRLEFYRMVEQDGKLVVLPAECKVTLMGDFMNLLNLPEVVKLVGGVQENSYDSIEERRNALNQLLKDPAFVQKHRESLMVYSHRIPTQGFNSMEMMIVKEFLPTWDGPHIITHPQITTKSGTDFDYDKLPTLFPSIHKSGRYKQENNKNKLIRSAEAILLDPVNFHRLVTPNSTELLRPEFERITEAIENPQENPSLFGVVQPTSHYKKWLATKIKDLLGIGAVNNTFLSLLQNADAKMEESFRTHDVEFPSKSPLLSSEEKEHVDLSDPFIIGTTVQKLDYINEFINITVDAPSDDIAGYANILRDNTGFFIVQILQGVPVNRILNLMHQPVVYKYHSIVNEHTSRGVTPYKASQQAISQLLGIDLTRLTERGYVDRKATEIWQDVAGLLPDTLSNSALEKNLGADYKNNALARQALAFYLVGLEQAGSMREIQSYLNFDTRPSRDALSSMSREQSLFDILETGLLTPETISRIKGDSVISHLDIHNDFITLSRQLFSIKRNPVYMNMAVRLAQNIRSADEKAVFFRVMDNDFLLSILQNYGDTSMGWVKQQLDGTLMDRWKDIKESPELEGTTIKDRIIASASAKTNVVNPRFWLGLDQEAEDFDQLAAEIRRLSRSEDKVISEFFTDLIKVSLYSTGFNQSPVYMLKGFPYEVVAQELQAAYNRFVVNPNYLDAFFDRFLYERGMQFGKYFIKEYKEWTGLRDITAQWRKENFRQDAFRFVDYTLSSAQKGMQTQLFDQLEEQSLVKFEEHPSPNYPDRTSVNAKADATIAMAVNFSSKGEMRTHTEVEKAKKKYIPVSISNLEVTPTLVNTIVKELNSVHARSLNIAGNGIYEQGIAPQEQLDQFVYELLSEVVKQHPIQSIRTGGQTGIDEAGAKAGIRLGIPTTILAPKGWKFRDASDKDISNEQQFKQRFDNIRPVENNPPPPIGEQNESDNPFEC